MMKAAEMTNGATVSVDDVERLLSPYRFRVCTSGAQVAEALEIRRRVYCEENEFSVPVPDEFDHRSWFLVAEDARTGEAIGTMRGTPRFAGPLELEQYLRLPEALRIPEAIELSRFAILPAHRRGMSGPSVSLGLFNLVRRFFDSVGMKYLLLATKAKRAATYHWLRFTSTHVECTYDGLGDDRHELMFLNLQRADLLYDGHPIPWVPLGHPFPQVIVPDERPRLGLHANPEKHAVGA